MSKNDVNKGSKGIFEILLLIAISATLSLSSIATSSSYGQAPPTTTPSQGKLPEVKITSPEDGNSVPILGNLTIIGTSSDDGSIACQVSVIVNDVKPYQPTIATGSGGPADYSQWKFTITPNYTSIKEGQNKITSKVMCPGSGVQLTKWYGVNVTGVEGSAAMGANSSSEQQSNGSDQSSGSAQSSGPVYSYSQQQNASNKTSDSGNAQDAAVKESENQENQLSNGQSQTAQSNNASDNITGVAKNFVPPFSP